MPRLLLFAPCQKAIIDRQDNSVSMIQILTQIKIGQLKPEGGGDIPPDAIIPLNWAIVTEWLQLPGDEGKQFEDRVEIVRPDGTVLVDAISPFAFTLRSHFNTVLLSAFPAGQWGEITLKLSLREVAEGTTWEPVAEYPLDVTPQ
jgi:hypothetical protein